MICAVLRCCYLNIVQTDPPQLGSKTRRLKMTFSMNRMLDVLVSFATVGLALTLAGATAFLGA